MVRTDNSLTGTHLLCAVGRHQEACSQVSFLVSFVILNIVYSTGIIVIIINVFSFGSTVLDT